MKSYVSHAFIGNSPRVYRPKCPHCKPATYAIPFKWRIIDPYNVTVACSIVCRAELPYFRFNNAPPAIGNREQFRGVDYRDLRACYIYIYTRIALPYPREGI